jgi:CRP/FNR family transcriptional regulator, cyclic AMP receptor protein
MPRVVALLDHDPELAGLIDPAQLAVAREVAWAQTLELPSGAWREQPWPPEVRSGLGLLVLDGLLLRHVIIAERSSVELLGAGDLLRPWQLDDEAGASVPRQAHWRVLRRTELALLDVDFARRVSAYPELHGALVAKAMWRTRALAVNIAILRQPRVDVRLEMLLWHLADRWGTVRSDGVLLPVKLTHRVLAELLAASRPTVSAAVATLQRSGTIVAHERGWLLTGSPPVRAVA